MRLRRKHLPKQARKISPAFYLTKIYLCFKVFLGLLKQYKGDYIMKRKRKIAIGSFFFRNKWSRRGRNLADFLMSFLLTISVWTCKIIFVAISWLMTFVSFMATKLFAKLFAKRPAILVPKEKEKAGEGLPDRFSRLDALMKELEGKPIKHKLDVGKIVEMTAGCSKVCLAKIVKNAEIIASARKGLGGNGEITENDLIISVSKINSVF